MWKFIFSLALVGCAAGSVTDPESLKEPTKAPQKEAPKEDAGLEDSGITCGIVESAWAGNCVVNLIECSDGTQKFDSKCYPPAWHPPWKDGPDPPFNTP